MEFHLEPLAEPYVTLLRHTAPVTLKQLARVGIDAVTSSPAEFQTFVKTDTERWAKVVKDANLRIE